MKLPVMIDKCLRLIEIKARAEGRVYKELLLDVGSTILGNQSASCLLK